MGERLHQHHSHATYMTATSVDDDGNDTQALPAQDELGTCRASLVFLLTTITMNAGRQLIVTVTPEPS